MRWLPSITIALSLLLVPLPRLVGAEFAELARQVPSSANAIAFVNVEKLMESPVAKSQGWAAKRDLAYGSGLTILPPEGKYAVLANHIDLGVWVPLWEAAILTLDHEPSMSRVAGTVGGTVDSIAGHDAVAVPGDAYVIKTGDRTAALMAPANRQVVARWMREIESRKAHQLSPYLAEAFRFADELGTPLILALDLEDALPQSELKGLLEQPDAKKFLEEQKLDPGNVLAMLVGLRGITLGVTFGEKPFGKVKVDFRSDVPMTADQAKRALLHALAIRGAMIDEFNDWKPAVNGPQMTLEGYLTESGMRRLSSLFDRPPALKSNESAPAATQQQQQQNTGSVAQTSQHYFHQIGELLDDLSKERKRNPGYNIAQIGVWMDKYAKKIDQLSVLNVDPDAIQYGATVADLLRAGYGAIRTSSARSRTRQLNTQMTYDTYSYGQTYGYTYRAGLLGAGVEPWGYSGYVNVPNTRAYWHDRTTVQAEERVNSAQSARDVVAQIDQLTADTRRKMTQKYQIDF
jgi:hypothetical protein